MRDWLDEIAVDIAIEGLRWAARRAKRISKRKKAAKARKRIEGQLARLAAEAAEVEETIKRWRVKLGG